MAPHPSPFARYMGFIPDPRGFVSCLNSPLPAYMRLVTVKASGRQVLDLLRSEGVSLESTPVKWFYRVGVAGAPGRLKAYHLGLIYPQTLASALPVLALDPRPGDIVLDLCAAPGGKTTHMAQLMEERGVVVANDRKFARITALTANIKRLGLTNILVTFYRGERFPLECGFDRILVDAPCSGEGKYRVGERGEMLFSRGRATNLPAIQKGILKRAFDLLRPGGELVYSTCTFNPEENEGVLTYLLGKREAQVLGWDPPLPACEGITEFEGVKYDPACRRCRRFYPHQTDTVGFFVARVAKPR